MNTDRFVIGVDYGTDSVRSIIVDTKNGIEIASAVFNYPRWRDGLYCDPSNNLFRQHPLDFTEGLEYVIKSCLKQAGASVAAAVKAISIATTGSTPAAVSEAGIPLAMLPGFEHNPNAMFILWKDHTAVKEAEEINAHAKLFSVNYLDYVGGIYSSEWFWAKLLHTLREDQQVASACYTWAEHCDWLPFMLTGGKHGANIMRSRCAAGHKALWHANWGGYPPETFFTGLDIRLKGFSETLLKNTYTADQPAGFLCAEWVQRLGLPAGVIIGMGALDAHIGAVGGQIEPYYLSKVMGTSTCDILVAPKTDLENKLVKGICGQVDGSVIPGMIGLEAGQSAFGDIYAWFRELLLWPFQLLDDTILKTRLEHQILAELSRQASMLLLDENAELSVDWLNGRRTPDANQLLKGAVTDLNLGTTAPKIFRALTEGTCFGARRIIERFTSEGIPVKGLIGIGGVAKKSPYIMQLMANILQMPIRINKADQTVAFGAAMFAATAAGIYPAVKDAMTSMGTGFDEKYEPDSYVAELYTTRYNKYIQTGIFIEKAL